MLSQHNLLLIDTWHLVSMVLRSEFANENAYQYNRIELPCYAIHSGYEFHVMRTRRDIAEAYAGHCNAAKVNQVYKYRGMVRHINSNEGSRIVIKKKLQKKHSSFNK